MRGFDEIYVIALLLWDARPTSYSMAMLAKSERAILEVKEISAAATEMKTKYHLEIEPERANFAAIVASETI